MSAYNKEVIRLFEAFMNKATNKSDQGGRLQADVFHARIVDYLWPGEKFALEDISDSGIKKRDKGVSVRDIVEEALPQQAEIYAKVACRNNLEAQASRFIDTSLTTENTVKDLQAAQLKNFAQVVARARSDKGLAV